jgi:hypothetical protein
MTDVEAAVNWTRILAAIGICISAAEYLAIDAQFGGSGIFADRIHGLDWLRVPKPLKALVQAAFSHRAATVAHSVQLGIAWLLFLPLDMRLYSLILLVLFLIQVHAFSQSNYGHDGSDQMLLLVSGALALAYAFHLKGSSAWIGLWFIVVQSLLSYASSGVSKLISEVWRSGRSLALIFDTAAYGAPQVSKWLSKAPALAFFGSWSVIILECCMPFVLVVPRAVMVVMLSVACSFHLGCAVTMGLNCFFWAFVSTFPMLYLFNVNLGFALQALAGTPRERLATVTGGALAMLVVAIVMIQYYELVPRLRKILSSQSNKVPDMPQH